MTTWALVPLTPKEDTAARRGRLTSGQSRASAAMTNFDAPGPACGVRVVKCNWRGMWPRATLSTVLMKPVTPAADSRWPRLVFTEPSTSGAEPSRSP